MASIIKKTSCDGTPLPDEEKDDVVRMAEIYLAKSGILPNSEHATAINHHSLIAKFEDGTWVRAGANSHEGELVAQYENLKKEPKDSMFPLSKAWLPSNYIEKLIPPVWLFNINKRIFLPKIFQVKISPKDLLEITKNNRHNNKKYVLVWMDCQTWALEAARMVKQKSDDNYDNSKDDEIKPKVEGRFWWYVTISAYIAIPVGVLFVGGVEIKNRWF